MSLAAANEISANAATAPAVLSELDGFFFFCSDGIKKEKINEVRLVLTSNLL